MRTSATPTDREVASGRLVDLLFPSHEDIDLGDIALSLAYQARYTGHARDYSVAQHSVHVASLLNPEDRIHGLLHDAPEYLIGDLSSPLKASLTLICPDFRRAWKWLEGAAETAIYAALGVPLPTAEQRERVKRADLIVLATEARDVFRTSNEWNLPHPPADPETLTIRVWGREHARERFLGALAAEGVGACQDYPAATVRAAA